LRLFRASTTRGWRPLPRRPPQPPGAERSPSPAVVEEKPPRRRTGRSTHCRGCDGCSSNTVQERQPSCSPESTAPPLSAVPASGMPASASAGPASPTHSPASVRPTTTTSVLGGKGSQVSPGAKHSAEVLHTCWPPGVEQAPDWQVNELLTPSRQQMCPGSQSAALVHMASTGAMPGAPYMLVTPTMPVPPDSASMSCASAPANGSARGALLSLVPQAAAAATLVATAAAAMRGYTSRVGVARTRTGDPQNGHAVSPLRTWRAHAPHGVSDSANGSIVARPQTGAAPLYSHARPPECYRCRCEARGNCSRLCRGGMQFGKRRTWGGDRRERVPGVRRSLHFLGRRLRSVLHDRHGLRGSISVLLLQSGPVWMLGDHDQQERAPEIQRRRGRDSPRLGRRRGSGLRLWLVCERHVLRERHVPKRLSCRGLRLNSRSGAVATAIVFCLTACGGGSGAASGGTTDSGADHCSPPCGPGGQCTYLIPPGGEPACDAATTVNDAGLGVVNCPQVSSPSWDCVYTGGAASSGRDGG
jgi:hypothetical protein